MRFTTSLLVLTGLVATSTTALATPFTKRNWVGPARWQSDAHVIPSSHHNQDDTSSTSMMQEYAQNMSSIMIPYASVLQSSSGNATNMTTGTPDMLSTVTTTLATELRACVSGFDQIGKSGNSATWDAMAGQVSAEIDSYTATVSRARASLTNLPAGYSNSRASVKGVAGVIGTLNASTSGLIVRMRTLLDRMNSR